MRMRHKKWSMPELLGSGYYVEEPEALRGKWKEAFARSQPLHLELGCGKGVFTAAIAASHPEINYLAIDISPDVLGVAIRNIDKEMEAAGRRPENILLAIYDIERIDKILAPGDQVDRIYINFCNPWPKAKHHKRRLTHPRQLKLYQAFLKPGASVYFKTDDDGLYLSSRGYFLSENFELEIDEKNLHQAGLSEDVCNFTTEHELMFSRQGVPIKFLKAVFKGPCL